jgi:hypothetical protein
MPPKDEMLLCLLCFARSLRFLCRRTRSLEGREATGALSQPPPDHYSTHTQASLREGGEAGDDGAWFEAVAAWPPLGLLLHSPSKRRNVRAPRGSLPPSHPSPQHYMDALHGRGHTCRDKALLLLCRRERVGNAAEQGADPWIPPRPLSHAITHYNYSDKNNKQLLSHPSHPHLPPFLQHSIEQWAPPPASPEEPTAAEGSPVPSTKAAARAAAVVVAARLDIYSVGLPIAKCW